ncbi:MAG: metallophosphatase family protein [Thermomicrobiales bacterium]|nr:metallophosphatase family protein [Thermomicrobiales bacterium]
MKILVLSDVHANLPAFEAVLRRAPAHDVVWSLGDIVGYGASPNECLDLLAETGATPALVGNHDLAAVGLLPIAWFNVYAATAAGWTMLQLTDEHRFRIRSSFTSEETGQYLLVHGSPRDPARDYIQTLDDAMAGLEMISNRHLLCGHTHVPMFAELVPGEPPRLLPIEPGVPYPLAGRRTVLNPGSVGQPRDRDPRAAAMLLDTDAETVTWIRTPYDVERAQNQILAAGLPKELASRLSHGR